MSIFNITKEGLRQALCMGNIQPAFQPIITVSEKNSASLSGLEVLARWHMQNGSVIPAHEFIAQAVRSGIEMELAQTMMEKSAPVVRKLAEDSGRSLVVGVNSGPVCLAHPLFEEACALFISACRGVDVSLALEITEQEPLMESLVPVLERLRELGIKIVLDDFGTGFATDKVLPWLKPDIVKLDRSLTMLAQGGDPLGRLSAALETICNHDATVLAEGVETYEAYDWLYTSGVRLYQGYLFGRPVPPEELSLQLIFPDSG